ncbi:hypothetical protein DERP_003969 [Dermatophagoides pteronyssinus]|uniref:Uncharacterized protein n=1 Tax=Dermatophagoides pteronyssinus TaxID=6956 RepID=A0ABQ8J7S9_DERPT|nr:hypothetical protein DERP_003969 [Dermatophagoides pteronyssinus]
MFINYVINSSKLNENHTCILIISDENHKIINNIFSEEEEKQKTTAQIKCPTDSKTAIPVKITAIVDYNQVGFKTAELDWPTLLADQQF